MYLRTTSQRRSNGTAITHMQIAESVWDPAAKRSATRVVYNCGRADDVAVQERLRRLARSILRRCSPEEIVADNPGWRVEDAWPHGVVHVLEALWDRLGIRAVLDEQAKGRKFGFSVERALFAMVANRLCAPCSKLYCWEQWLREDVRIEGTGELELQHLYRAMDFLEQNKDAIEKEIFHRVSDLLNLDVEIIFYDTTSLHFEVDDVDHGGDDDVVRGSKQSGAKQYKAPRKRGHSKNGRGDAPQIVVGLAVTREGFPIRHWVFPGNTVDVTTVKKVRDDLRGWRLSRCVFVGDAGMVSDDNLRALSLAGGKYIVCMPMRREKEVAREVLGRAGRYKAVAQNLRVKEVVVGDGERRRRYVVCHNPQEEKRQCAHRTQALAELRAELASLNAVEDSAHSKRACELRASGRYGKYLRFNKAGKPEINLAKVREEERLDGKFVVHSDDDTLSPEDMALGYKQLMRVEEAWRAMKSGLKLRPVFHWAPHRIHAHVAITVLALLVERAAEHACEDTWRNIRDDLQTIKLARLAGPEGKVWQTTEPRPEASKRLKSLGVPNPPLIVNLA